MAEARTRDAWNRSACVMALLANLHRDPKKRRPFNPSDFHPMDREKQQLVGKVDVSILKSVFCPGEE